MHVLEQIKRAGVVGAGGAGFPTHVKLSTKQPMLIINGVECEPLLETDKYLMRHYSKDIVETALLVANAIDAQQCVIGVKDKNTAEIEALEKAITHPMIRVQRIGNYYPAGDEHILVQEVLGKSIPAGGIPLDVGAVVINVATVLDIHRALLGKPVTHRLVTVTGEVKAPCLIHVPIGTSVADCLRLAGGVRTEKYAVLIGGPIMGTDCAMDATEKTFITKTTGGLVVLDEDSYIIQMKRLPMSHIVRRTESACIQCQMCTDLCPRYLNGHPLYPHKVMRAIGNKEKSIEMLHSALICCECGVCELYACPMGLSPKTVNQHVKQELLAQGIRFPKGQVDQTHALEDMPYRKIHALRMMARIGLLGYEHIHLTQCLDYHPARVELLLKQHVGKAATPLVTTGAYVTEGMCIATVAEGDLGADLHASISGLATVLSDCIRIEATEVDNG